MILVRSVSGLNWKKCSNMCIATTLFPTTMHHEKCYSAKLVASRGCYRKLGNLEATPEQVRKLSHTPGTGSGLKIAVSSGQTLGKDTDIGRHGLKTDRIIDSVAKPNFENHIRFHSKRSLPGEHGDNDMAGFASFVAASSIFAQTSDSPHHE